MVHKGMVGFYIAPWSFARDREVKLLSPITILIGFCVFVIRRIAACFINFDSKKGSKLLKNDQRTNIE